MRVLERLQEAVAACRAAGGAGRLGFVPTMGALHAGHAALVERARAENDTVVASIFVNPLQFDDPGDYERYPRAATDDARLLTRAGADLLLRPRREELYPEGFATRVVLDGALTGVLEGAARPGHFDGVTTVVAKLFGLVGPCRAYFGRKDYQQTVVVRRLVADLHLPVEVVVCDTVRERDGLALSSRNVFLSDGERRRARALVDALCAAQTAFAEGERSGDALRAAMAETLRPALDAPPDYAQLVDPDDLRPRAVARPGDVALVAGRLGRVRLIDNHVLGARIGPFARGAADRAPHDRDA